MNCSSPSLLVMSALSTMTSTMFLPSLLYRNITKRHLSSTHNSALINNPSNNLLQSFTTTSTALLHLTSRVLQDAFQRKPPPSISHFLSPLLLSLGIVISHLSPTQRFSEEVSLQVHKSHQQTLFAMKSSMKTIHFTNLSLQRPKLTSHLLPLLRYQMNATTRKAWWVRSTKRTTALKLHRWFRRVFIRDKCPRLTPLRSLFLSSITPPSTRCKRSRHRRVVFLLLLI